MKKWTYETVKEEAKKYTSRTEFNDCCGGAYNVARKNGWLDDYDWFVVKQKPRGYWTYETCYEEAKKYSCKKDFQKYSGSAYTKSRINKWLNDFKWLIDERLDLINDKIDSVYVYIFESLKTAYVGRTLIKRQNDRDREHIFNEKDTIHKFIKAHNIECPQMVILETDLNLKEGVEKEEFYFQKYKQLGYSMLNKTKCGSIGSINNGKWNYKSCMEEAKKYTHRSEMKKYSNGAYGVARRNGWLDDYAWFMTETEARSKGAINKKWDYETCKEEARKYDFRYDFKINSSSAYNVARRNGWLDEYVWLKYKQKPKGYWDYETCKECANQCFSKSDFENRFGSACTISRKNGWLDEFFPKD